MWKQNCIRVVISHRDIHREKAAELAKALSVFGVHCFLAHDTIPPGTTWRDVLLDALSTMELLIVFLTDDFDASPWGNQEVGFALGRSIPIIALRVGAKEPSGFLEARQALVGSFESPAKSALPLVQLIPDLVAAGDRLIQGLIDSLLASTSFMASMERFELLNDAAKQLSRDDAAKLINGFHANDQLYGCNYLAGYRFLHFLRQKTGMTYVVRDHRIVES
jgi:hypothetical protein